MLSSLLYVPATSDRFIASAARSDADAVILDLEDSIPASEKEAARQRLPRVVPELAGSGKQVFVRINHAAELLRVDVLAAVASGAGGLVVPKVETPSVLDQVAALIDAGGPVSVPVPFIPLIESPRGILNADAIAAHPRVIGVICGSEDLATSMNAQAASDVLRIPKILVHLAAKANHRLSFGLLQTIANYRNLEELERSINEAKKFGFDGTTCIHPSAVPLINRAFRPDEQEKARARRLVEAAEANAAKGIGAFLFEGDFVDAPVIERARRLLDT
ncbi:(S)-citramalyl-CoA lyase OS=Castellaniella defragrans OX=75697 GN=HNR28_001788 PE=4 SV=1 [Castellaniella defragrans]